MLSGIERDSQENWDDLALYHDYFLPIGFSIEDARGLARLAREHLKPHARILLIGCATGKTLEPFLEAGLDTIGVDLSSKMLLAGKTGRPGNRMLAADARALPFRDGSFQMVIIATGVIDHSTDADALTIFRECRRLLQEQGAVFVFRHAGHGEDNWLYRRLRIQTRDWFYAQRYGALCRFLQQHGLARLAAFPIMRLFGHQRPEILLQEPVLLRAYCREMGLSDPWKIFRLFPYRVRLWRDMDLQRLFAIAGLVTRGRQTKPNGSVIWYALSR